MEFIFEALRIETLNVLANMTIEEKLNFHTSLVDRLANEQSGIGSIILQTMIYVTEHEYLLRAAQAGRRFHTCKFNRQSHNRQSLI